jgi:hypothetical protein
VQRGLAAETYARLGESARLVFELCMEQDFTWPQQADHLKRSLQVIEAAHKERSAPTSSARGRSTPRTSDREVHGAKPQEGSKQPRFEDPVDDAPEGAASPRLRRGIAWPASRSQPDRFRGIACPSVPEIAPTARQSIFCDSEKESKDANYKRARHFPAMFGT